ncbi:MAG: hypothetical protein JWO94_3267 [Verrucomicrobiaceae bacterium]|nr:hypothetical protein [Verrucomicrobiaceae bacterium]
MPHSFFHGWKTRLFHLSHSPLVLANLTAGILLSGFLIACAIVGIRGNAKTMADPAAMVMNRFQQRLDKISGSNPNQARALAAWLFDVTASAPETPKDGKVSPATALFLAKIGVASGFQLKEIVRTHVPDASMRKPFEDFIEVRTQTGSAALAARKRLEAAAGAIPPVPFANEFLGDLLWDEGMMVDAIEAFRREGVLPDARRARRLAFNFAVEHRDQKALREMLAEPLYKDASARDRHVAAVLLGDWGLAATSYFKMETQHLRPAELMFVVLAGFLWYAVFVRFGVRDRWRWVRPLPAVLAGIASLWPTMILIHWQELHGGQQENGEFLHDLVFYVAGVGLREEASKLLLFALFIPWLLKQRSSGTALLTGAFIGLGFAMDENRAYFHAEGLATVAVGRLLTANFFHAAATGLAGLALYDLVRTRFGSAERFIATFVAVVVVHGLYDWVLEAGSSLTKLGNLTMFSVVILALLAQQFFDHLGGLIHPQRGMISLLSMFLVGVSGLIAAGFILAAMHDGTMKAVSAVGVEALGLVPITVLYARKFVSL